MLTRLADLSDASIDINARTVELAFSSEYDEGERSFGIEILGHAPGEVDLTRLNDAAAVLLNHDTGKQIGVVQSASIDSDRIGRAVVRFGNSPLAQEVFQDIADGIRKHVSVGYRLLDAESAGERDGVTVVRITRWQPYEISIVPVPFDPTVGVGRNAQTLTRSFTSKAQMPNNLIDRLDRQLSGNNLARNALLHGMRQARAAMADSNTFGVVGARTAGAMVHINLDDAMGAAAPSAHRSYGLTVTARPAGETQTFSSEILQSSRVLQAGARLLPIDDAPMAVGDLQGVIAWYKRESAFVVVKPAAFGVVADGANVTPSALPIVTAPINLGESAAQAVHFKLSRDVQKSVDDETLQFELERAIVLGLAQLADRVLLEAVAATSPANFSLAAAAASGARFGELRAIVGSNATGATVNAAGDLVAAGIRAELTDQSASTVAGVFSRSAIACEREIRVLLRRTDLQGNLEVTVFANMQAVLPSLATFWKVAA